MPYDGICTLISGGQTGADRAALDWAISHGIPHGGWCPQGRLAEDGMLAPRYLLTETETAGYASRTNRNVRDSDGTLILNIGAMEGGTAFTIACAKKRHRPYRVVQLDTPDALLEVKETAEWLAAHSISRLNVAGPRESKRPGIYEATWAFIEALLGSGHTPAVIAPAAVSDAQGVAVDLVAGAVET